MILFNSCVLLNIKQVECIFDQPASHATPLASELFDEHRISQHTARISQKCCQNWSDKLWGRHRREGPEKQYFVTDKACTTNRVYRFFLSYFS